MNELFMMNMIEVMSWWLVMKSNEFEMEPLILSLKPGASYKHFDPSESDTFIYCLKGCVTYIRKFTISGK